MGSKRSSGACFAAILYQALWRYVHIRWLAVRVQVMNTYWCKYWLNLVLCKSHVRLFPCKKTKILLQMQHRRKVQKLDITLSVHSTVQDPCQLSQGWPIQRIMNKLFWNLWRKKNVIEWWVGCADILCFELTISLYIFIDWIHTIQFTNILMMILCTMIYQYNAINNSTGGTG